VVMVHGSAQGSRVGGERHFSAQERLAEQGWQVVVPDRPGHGRSPDPGRPDDAEADGEWVAGLLGEGAHLVGHSFGGCVALAAAARRPGAVRSLTLIEPAMQRLATSNWHVKLFVLRIIRTLVFSTSPSARAIRFARMMHIPEEIRGGSHPEELNQMGKAISRLKLPSKETLQRELGVIKREGIPLLVVTGGWSPAIDATGEVAATLGAGRSRVIRSEHHFPQLISEEFNEALTAFMKESDTKRSS
jgi:pimeloyl-ACP methyl ester carboxylesterase